MSKDNEQEFSEVLETYINQKKLYRTEGTEGVKNLCKLARALGYKDFQSFGQFDADACYGDLLEFLGDNPGAIEAIVEWISDNGEKYGDEWKESLLSDLPSEESETEEDQE